MTDREAIMYQILGVISNTDTPLIFKGALITKLILAEHGYTDVEHAYNKLRGVDGKPSFNDVYPYLIKFVHPFAQRNETLRTWNSDKQDWED
ncbi:MAG: hypothetical protein LBC71_01295 [Oscillospiraceae bacterium]|jgi:hypothetical protein|nr:hypothetical protein [Oscillospiraceae bacterium]